MNTTEKILDLISKNSITAKKLSEILSLPQSAISEWKKGKCEPSAKAIAKIAQYFSVSTDYLLGLTEDPNPSNTQIAVTEPQLSEDEQDLLDVYRNLDNKGKSYVKADAYKESDRMKAEEKEKQIRQRKYMEQYKSGDSYVDFAPDIPPLFEIVVPQNAED